RKKSCFSNIALPASFVCILRRLFGKILKRKIMSMNIDRTEFIAWMQRIVDRLDILGEAVRKQQNKLSAFDGEELFDNQDLMELLKISPRSLQRYRSSGRLPYYTISGKLYYKNSDVHLFIREYFNNRVIREKPKPDK